MAYRVHGMIKGNYLTGGYFPVAASQYFRHGHGGFVCLDANGRLTIAVTASEKLFGWAIVPSSSSGAAAAGVNYWLSSATAGADVLYVITDINAWFSIPVYQTGALVDASQARVGEAVDINCTNDAATGGQTTDLNTSTNDILLVKGWTPDDTKVIFVSMNPDEIQVTN